MATEVNTEATTQATVTKHHSDRRPCEHYELRNI